MAKTSGNASIVAQCIAKAESSHADMKDIILWLILNQIIMNLYISFLAIVIVCIDNCKWLGQELSRTDDCVSGSPWFGSVCRLGETFRKLLHLLICICYFRDLGYAGTDGALKFFLKILADDKYDFVKSCFQCISDGIIHDDLTVWSNWCKLFNSISKAASNSGSHNYKGCFFHRCTLPF